MIGDPPDSASNPYSPAIRLLLIPFLVYLAWLIEVFLLAGKDHLLEHPEPAGIALYTIIGCILTGIVIPMILIRKAFLSGAVNMFQIGFRTIRRTILACSVTAAIGFGMILLLNPFGIDRIAFASAFLLLLPTAAASVMICWILIGTHLQAFVRSGGAVVSIPVGVITTGLLFAISTLVMNPSVRQDGSFIWPLCFGMGAALFFFAVRDVYATVIMVTGISVFARAGMSDSPYLHGLSPLIYASTVLAVAALVGIHIFLFMNYTTIQVPSGLRSPGGKGGSGGETG
jgi:hypothetical protein